MTSDGHDLRGRAQDAAREVARDVSEHVDELVEAVKPHLRGWLHLVMAPLALIGGLVLTSTAPTQGGRIAAMVFTITAGLLFEAEDVPGLVIHTEICEDFWAATPPSTEGALAGAPILAARCGIFCLLILCFSL